MSVVLTEVRQKRQRKRFNTRFENSDQTERPKPNTRRPYPPLTSDDEIAFVTRTLKFMLFLAVTPLTLFVIVNHFYPELFLVPITPN